MLLAGALGLAEPVRPVFVAAARGRAPAAEVLAAMRREQGPVVGSAPGRGPLWSGCPYLGLVPFEEQDARLFYGRGELAVQLVRRLSERLDGTGILLVAGESGSGKSSCGLGRCRFSLIPTQHSARMSGRRQRQNGRNTPRVNHSPASADDTCRPIPEGGRRAERRVRRSLRRHASGGR